MSEWVELLVTYDETEADIVIDILKAEGIEVVKRSSKVSPYPVSVGKMGEIKLLVRQDSLEEAEKVMRIMQEGPDQEEP